MVVAIVVIALVLVALTGAALSVRIRKQCERAVVLRLGRVQGGARGPGLIAIVPLVDRVHRVSLRIVTTRCTPDSRPNYGRVLGSMGPTRSRPANVIDPLGLFGVGRLGHHIGLPSLEDPSDTAAGFGDGAFGLTRKIRQALDVTTSTAALPRTQAATLSERSLPDLGVWRHVARQWPRRRVLRPGMASAAARRWDPGRSAPANRRGLSTWSTANSRSGSTATRWCAGRGRMCWCELAGRTRSWDPRDRPATYLTVMSPAGYEKYLVDLAKGLRHAAADKDAATPPTSAGS